MENSNILVVSKFAIKLLVMQNHAKWDTVTKFDQIVLPKIPKDVTFLADLPKF